MALNQILGGQGLTSDPARVAREVAEEQRRVNLANELQRQAQQNEMIQAQMRQDIALRELAAQRDYQDRAFAFQEQQAELERANKPFNLQEALFQEYKRGRRTPEVFEGLGMRVEQPQSAPQVDVASQVRQARSLGLEPTKQVGGKVTYEPKKQAGARDTKQFDQAIKLHDKFNTQSKDFFKVRDSWGRIQASADDPSPAGDLALIFNFMKVLDPGSVVRESEFANAANAKAAIANLEEGGTVPVPNFVRSGIQRAFSGKLLLDEQRVDFVSRAQKLFDRQAKVQQGNIDRYTQIADRWGLDPADVVLQISQQQATVEPQQGVTVEWID